MPSAGVQKSRRHFKIVGAWRLTWSKFHTEDPHKLGTATQNALPRICATLAECTGSRSPVLGLLESDYGGTILLQHFNNCLPLNTVNIPEDFKSSPFFVSYLIALIFCTVKWTCRFLVATYYYYYYYYYYWLNHTSQHLSAGKPSPLRDCLCD